MKTRFIVFLFVFIATAILSFDAFGCSKIVVKPGMDYQKTFSSKNTKYVIKQDINLQGKTVKIGEGSTLVFKGGSLANGTLVGNKTKVKADNYEIFKHGLRTFRGHTLNGGYKYAVKTDKAIIIEGTWNNAECGDKWTGMDAFSSNSCAGLAINNYIRLHKRGTEIIFPKGRIFYVYERIVCSGYSIDFNGSVIKSIDFDKVEDKTIALPIGSKPRTLKSLYGLLDFNCDNAYIKNLTIDGRASHRSEIPSLGTECLISMASNKNCLLQNVIIKDAVGCGICTYSISNCSFDNVTFNGCGEHGLYTHSYNGSLFFNNCCFLNCGQDQTLFKLRGASACVKFSGARDHGYSALKDLKAYFTNCLFESDYSQQYVATFYSDIPYAEFTRCSWKGVKGYSIVSPQLAEHIGRLVEFKFVECNNPCYRIQSYNTIRRLIRCTNITNPFSDSIELTDCEISVGYADVENVYSTDFVGQYDIPVVCTNCKFIKGSEDIPIRNSIVNPRPMVFDHCKWEFAPSTAINYKGSYYLVLTNSNTREATTRSVMFSSCDINIDKYRLLFCSDTDICFKECDYQSSYDTLVDGRSDSPNRVRVLDMKNRKKLNVARHSIQQND